MISRDNFLASIFFVHVFSLIVFGIVSDKTPNLSFHFVVTIVVTICAALLFAGFFSLEPPLEEEKGEEKEKEEEKEEKEEGRRMKFNDQATNL